MEITKEEIIVKGKSTIFESARIENKVIVFSGKIMKIAAIQQEWFEDVERPEEIASALKKTSIRPDLFTFIQRFPETESKYNYLMEWDKVTALRIRTYNEWWEKQISYEMRKKAKRSEKRGVEIKLANFDDELIRGISGIFNSSPLRQGKPFWHFGKDFETVKKEMSLDLERSDFIGAYYNGELIGIVKLLYAGKIATPGIIVSKIAHRDKYVSNSLMAKTVEMCAMKGIQYLTYGTWWRGSMADFLRRNGFERMKAPRYYIPLTTKGKIILKLKLHRSIKEMLPENLILKLINLRTKWNSRKYGVVDDI